MGIIFASWFIYRVDPPPFPSASLCLRAGSGCETADDGMGWDEMDDLMVGGEIR
jgi:hypothetical protein